MADAAHGIMASIRAELTNLPEELIHGALEFYEEYFADAREAGHPDQETLRRLGGIREIAAQIRAEAVLSRAEHHPGPIRLIGGSWQALRGLAGAAARFSIFLGASIPYTLALCLYLLALAAFVSAAASAALLGFGITTIPGAGLMTKVSVASAALASAACLLATGMGLWAGANGIARLTLQALRRGLRRDRPVDRPAGNAPAVTRPRKGRLKAALLACLVAFAAGVVGLFLSPLPSKYFSIWSSAKPAHLTVRAWSYPSASIRELQVSTMSSAIILDSGADRRGEIRISYEEPEWLTGATAATGASLSFRETTSGALPFMGFIARHPGTTSVRITLPRGYHAVTVNLRSGSGMVTVAAPVDALAVRTGTGDIRFQGAVAASRIRVGAPRGSITVNGSAVAEHTYLAGPANGAVADLETSGGTVEIQGTEGK